jgi:Ca2+-binding RTX toxin-like protein
MTSLYPSTTLVVVDSTVRDYQGLVDSISPDTEVIVLNPAENGIEQITEALVGYRNLRSLHILSHGETGALRLGNAWLTFETLEQHADRLRTWVRAIATNANILLYGCRVASNAAGQAFVERFSQLTGAVVAASTTLTGSRTLGGDWCLNFTTAPLQATIPFSAEAMAAYPHVLAEPRRLFTETFRGEDVVDPRWLFGVGDPSNTGQANPFLTARDDPNPSTGPDPSVGGGLPGNSGTPPNPPVDPDGEGALRLTNATNNQATYVLYNNPIPSSAGLIIEFDFYAYGGSSPGADGISFFLADGSNPPQQAGAFGGSLGYANNNQPPAAGPGVVGGYLGIGFDEFGNYSNPTEGRQGGPGFTPDSIAVRGSQANNYAYLTGTETLPYSIDVPTATNREQARRRARIVLTPEGLLSVQVDANSDGDYTDAGESPESLQNYNIVAANGALPDTFTFGFASGTGIFRNVHEIRTLDVSTFTAPPIVTDVTNNVPSGTTINLTGLSATDPDGTVESFTIVTLPSAEQGTLFLGNPAAGGIAVAAGQELTPAQISQLFFQPGPGFTGAAFTYNATDNLGAEAATPATVTLALLAADNQPPTAGNVNIAVTDAALTTVPTLPVADPDGTVASITIVTLPSDEQGELFVGNPEAGGRLVTAGETLSLAEANQLFFRPVGGFTGDTFTYFARDNEGAVSAVATVTFSSDGTGTNQPPIANNLNVPVNEGAVTPLSTLPVSDPDGTVETVTVLTLPPTEQGVLFVGDPLTGGRPVTAGETLSLSDANQLFFRPANGFTGGSFTYQATDNGGATSPVATITFSQGGTATNQPPIASNSTANFNPDSVTRVPTPVATDPDGSVVSFTIVSLPPTEQGQLFVGSPIAGGRPVAVGDILTPAEAEQLFFQANDDFSGGSFTFFATDNLGATSNTATFTLASSGIPGPVPPGGDDCVPGIRREGTDGANSLRGTPDQDTLIGGGGNDTLRGLDCDDTLNGGGGRDRIFGGDAGDTINGNQGNDRLFGENGNDTINGGLGNDRVNGGRGDDVIFGRRGNDRLNGRGGNDTIIGERGRDRINGGANNDFLQGRQGNDRINGNNGNDLIFGNLGRDRLSGGKKNDTIYGGRGNDRLKGQGGEDVLFGQRSNDRLLGGSQADLLIGGGNRDILIGGGGADTLRGGPGPDRFVFRNITHGGDIITDFQTERDRLDFSKIFSRPGYGSSRTFAYIQRIQSGADTLIRVDSNGQGNFIDYLTMLNVTTGDLSARNFIV